MQWVGQILHDVVCVEKRRKDGFSDIAPVPQTKY